MDFEKTKKAIEDIRDRENQSNNKARFFISKDWADLHVLKNVKDKYVNPSVNLDLEEYAIRFRWAFDITSNNYKEITYSEFKEIYDTLPDEIKSIFKPYLKGEKDK